METIKARDVANYGQALSLIHTLGGFRSMRNALLDQTELTGDEATIGSVMTNSGWFSFVRRAQRLEAIPV